MHFEMVYLKEITLFKSITVNFEFAEYEIMDRSRLSRVEFRRTKTIYHQYNVMDGRKKSFSWLGIYRRWNHISNRIYCLFCSA